MNKVPPVFIQAVPWAQERVRNVKTLLDRLDGHDVSVVWDEHRSGFETFNRVQRKMSEHPEQQTLGSILLEDDVVLADFWEEVISESVEQNPTTVINYFASRAHETAPKTYAGKDFGGNVCVYYPPDYPARYTEWVKGRQGSFQEQYHDLHYGRFLHSLKVDYLQWEPAPVQHLPFTSSVLPGRSKKRQSRTFRMKR